MDNEKFLDGNINVSEPETMGTDVGKYYEDEDSPETVDVSDEELAKIEARLMEERRQKASAEEVDCLDEMNDDVYDNGEFEGLENN